MRVPPSAWKLWLLVIMVGFFILETLSLVSKEKGDTLSENTRRWLQVHDIEVPSKRGRAAIGGGVVGVLTGLLIWFVPHIASTSWGVKELIFSLVIGGIAGSTSLSALVPPYVPPVSKGDDV